MKRCIKKSNSMIWPKSGTGDRTGSGFWPYYGSRSGAKSYYSSKSGSGTREMSFSGAMDNKMSISGSGVR